MSLLPVHAVYGEDVIQYQPMEAPADGVYYEVKSTWDFRGMSRPTWNENGGTPIFKVGGLPDVWRLYVKNPKLPNGKPKRDYVQMDYEHTHFMLKVNVEIQRGIVFENRGDYFRWWNSLSATTKSWYAKELTSACTDYRSHTNKFGMNNMHNHLTGERADKDDPKFAMLVTGRARMKAVLENGKIMQRNIVGVDGLAGAFECINASGDYWSESPLKNWWKFDYPMSTARDMVKDLTGGVRIVRDDKHELYPQFGGKLVFPIWLPYDEVAWLPMNQVRMLSEFEAVRGKRLTT